MCLITALGMLEGSPSGPIIANPEDALTAAFNGGKGTPTANPENAFTAAFNGGAAPLPPQRPQIPPSATALVPPGPIQQGPAPSGSPWDPQGVGYAKSWDPQGVAMAASQRMAAPSVRGALSGPTPNPGDAPQSANSPFTMVMRPNAPANSQGGRGGGGPALTTALDLSGLFGGGGQQQGPAPRTYTPDSRDPRYQAQAPHRGGGGYSAVQAPQDPVRSPIFEHFRDAGAWSGSASWLTRGLVSGLFEALESEPTRKIKGMASGPSTDQGRWHASHTGPVNQPGFWGVHGRGGWLRRNQ